jgi:hypothetical protein
LSRFNSRSRGTNDGWIGSYINAIGSSEGIDQRERSNGGKVLKASPADKLEPMAILQGCEGRTLMGHKEEKC